MNLARAILGAKSRLVFYRTGWPTVENLVEDADDDFFRRVLHNENHVLHPLLPPTKRPWLWTATSTPWAYSYLHRWQTQFYIQTVIATLY